VSALQRDVVLYQWAGALLHETEDDLRIEEEGDIDMTHTPGPWERRGEYNLEIWEYQAPEPAVEGEEDAGDDGSGWLSVCTVHQPGEANARLIAAAPQLLEALEVVAGAWDDELAKIAQDAIGIAKEGTGDA
jgi:hypothetical protein